jgi:16S rRNA C967 or C1407 C5-methylase (RsmB/RsmF family)
MRERFVDLDRTLAHFDVWEGPTHIGEPIPEMLKKVKTWLANGDKITIFTARISPDSRYTKLADVEAATKAVKKWCVKHLGQELGVTCQKTMFDVLLDDRAEHIDANTGMTREERLAKTIREWREEKKMNDTQIVAAILFHLDAIVRQQTA